MHFWLGKESSQDEQGVAAYKTVEMDDLLDSAAVQHRELQGHESALFRSYFPRGVRYMEGGIGSGFRHVGPKEVSRPPRGALRERGRTTDPHQYKPRLFELHADSKRQVQAYQVPVAATSLNDGDAFVLDAGLAIYLFVGKSASAFAKARAAAVATDLKGGRGGAKVTTTLDANFWKLLNGSPKDVRPPTDRPPEQVKEMDRGALVLMKLSEESGALKFSKVAEGTLHTSQLEPRDVFVVDAGIELFVWIGSQASGREKSSAMKYATQYLRDHGKPETTPVTVVKEGQLHHVFMSLFGEPGHQPVKGGGFCVVM